MILDKNYQDNGKFFQNQGKKFSGDIEELQYLNLKEFIDDMIRVKAGYYSTIFRKKIKQS
ncbi:MAG: hypothetical protein VZR09_02370 [Candidatus Gastranaerophilaceae bacterium]|nr:hypothetical protein [Candidatus Gastranaerophilaceae bacterium]